jgi:peptide/nickel transport system substrate-binding protein
VTWEIKLRSGIAFHDDTPFDATAAAASINRIVDPKTASRQRPFFSAIKSAEAVDATTLRITTDGPDPALPARLYWLTIVSPKAVSEPGFGQKAAGTGPYRLVEWNKGTRIVLAKNPAYWSEAGNVAQITYRFVPEAGTRLAGLLAGDFDLITNLQPEDVKTVPQAVHVLGSDLPFVSLNAVAGLTKDVRVRQALNYAVDKQALAKDLFGGYATLLKGQLLAPSWFGFNPALEAYPYDVAKAKALLKEAGVLGQTLDVIAPSGRWLKDKELAETLSAYWEAAGLKVNFRVLAWNEYLDTLNKNRPKTPAAITSSHSNQLFDADRTLSAYYRQGGVAAANDDTELASLIDQARVETAPDKRKALYARAVKIGRDDALFVFLLNNEDIYGLSKRVAWRPRVDGLILIKELRVTQ